MAHKVHPKIFRTRETKDWGSRWFDKKNYPAALREDFLVREFLKKKFKEASIESIEIERFAGKANVIINSSRPGIIIGRGGAGIEEAKKAITQLLKKEKGNFSKEIKVEIREIKNPWTSASLAGQWIAQQLEKRSPFRQVLKQALTKIMANKEIQGARIEIAGRLGGAEIARREWTHAGRLPLQTLRADIDYSLEEALTTYGIIGIKVWIFKGEKFEK